jgi:hypothetical protein
LNEQEAKMTLDIIHRNEFSYTSAEYQNHQISRLLEFYINYRKDIITPGTELYNLKQEYDQNPTKRLRRGKLK